MGRALRVFCVLVLFVLVSLHTASLALADAPWGMPQAIDGTSDHARAPDIAMSGSDVVAIWVQSTGTTNGTYSIQSNRSTDGGETWEGRTLVSGDPLYWCEKAKVAMSGSKVVAVWHEKVDSNTTYIRSSYSTDKGETWSSPANLNDSGTGQLDAPQVVLEEDTAVVAWLEVDSPHKGVVVNRSEDGGASWEGTENIDFDYGVVTQHMADEPRAVIDGQDVVIAWKTMVSDGGTTYHRVYANSSSDGGETWGGAQVLSTADESYELELAMSGSNVLAIWRDSAGNSRVYCNRSTDSGATWEGAGTLDNGALGSKDYPGIAVSGTTAVAVWIQYTGSASIPWGNCSDDGGATWEGPQVLNTGDTMWADEPQVAVSGSTAVAACPRTDASGYSREYASYSTDGGTTWSAFELIQDDENSLGMSTRMDADGTRAVVVWQRFDWTNPDDICTNYFDGPASIDVELQTGWNMVSVPVTAADMSTSAVFGTADAVYWWNPETKSYTIPATIDPKKGYWVAVSGDQTITVTGQLVETWEDNLSTGWNMIGSVSGDAVAVGDLEDVPADTLEDGALYTWNPAGKCYSVATHVEQGKAYWAACTEACNLHMGPPPT